jgi:hypothetical protein
MGLAWNPPVFSLAFVTNPAWYCGPVPFIYKAKLPIRKSGPPARKDNEASLVC